MAIVKMKKITIAAPKSERDEVLGTLQSQGNVHLIDLSQNASEIKELDFFDEARTLSETEGEYNRVKFTYDFLQGFSKEKNSMFSKKEELSIEAFEKLQESINWREIHNEVSDIEERLGAIKSKRGKLYASLEQYRQWKELDISSIDLDKMKSVEYFIGTISQRYEGDFQKELSETFNEIHIERISERQQEIGFFILCYRNSSEEVSEILKKYGFSKVSLDLKDTPSNSIKSIELELSELDKEEKLLNKKAEELAGRLGDVKLIYDYMLSKLEKERVISSLAKTSRNFILQGWVPAEDEDRIRTKIESRFKDSYVEFEEPGEDENPPIALKNNALNEPFEIVTSMYSLPNHSEIDPTPVLAPFFLIFFGIMMADIGYGAAMLVGGLLMLKFMDIEGGARKIIKLIVYSSIPTIIFGALYGSVFTETIKPLWLNPLDNPMLVLVVSVILGIIHIMVALGVKAYQQIRSGGIIDAVFDVGSLYAIILGIAWYVLDTMGIVPAGKLGIYLAILGVVGVFIGSGRGSQGLAGKIGSGVYGVYGLTGYVGDALSYSRLMALGLATGLIGSAFNIMTDLLGDSVLKFIVGPIILIVGHTFNLLINALGTYVHTSRLQYVEFFGKFYEGGGKPFEPLSIKTKHVKVKTDK